MRDAREYSLFSGVSVRVYEARSNVKHYGYLEGKAVRQ